jgi:hypothetical protein
MGTEEIVLLSLWLVVLIGGATAAILVARREKDSEETDESEKPNRE